MRSLSFIALVIATFPLFGQDEPQVRNSLPSGSKWSKVRSAGAQHGILHDAFQSVRGDSGKWNDGPMLRHAPPLSLKPTNMLLDDWYDELEETRHRPLTSSEDSWLLVRTRQLDDNDRIWIERIERNGNQITIVLNEVIWQGRYSKTFTFYAVTGINLGQLAPGKYEAKGIIKPFVFTKFDGDGRPTGNWPIDERPDRKKEVEIKVEFTIAADAVITKH